MGFAVGIVVWVLTGVAATFLGGEFMSGPVFVLGGILGAIAGGIASTLLGSSQSG